MRARLASTAAALWLAATAAAHPSAVQPPLAHHVASRISMATEYAIDAYGPDAAVLPRIVEDAFDEVDRIDRLMSHYKATSALSQVNRDAARHPVTVDRELFDFIAEAMRYYHDSGGAFDITVGPLMKAWGFFDGDGRVPAERDLAAARRHVGGSHVILDASATTIAFDEPGVELDLGGIAKGYAVDRVVGLLARRRIETALVSAGGSTIYAVGAPPDRDGWSVTVVDPIDPRATAFTVRLKDRALSIAGSSEKSFDADGVTYSHIMDPRSGRPVQGTLSVAVLAPTGTAGDALDDAFFVLGTDASRLYLDRLSDVDVYFFLPTRTHGWTMVHERTRP